MSYEEKIEQRRNRNREVLKTLGIYSTVQESETPKNPVKKKYSVFSKKKEILTPKRRSGRLLGKEPLKYDESVLDEIFSESKTLVKVTSEKIKRENMFGAIAGVPVGTEFATRLEASHAGIHRPTVAGIHGNPALGCYSLALSGGYEDDYDLGDSFLYTGEGGRDLKGTKANPKNLRTAPQSKDQVLERGNLALTKNIENNVPVRVLRGYKLQSEFAPLEGYRYDGLYKVVEYYAATGKSGFHVYKFRLERLEDQEPAPWSENFLKEKNH